MSKYYVAGKWEDRKIVKFLQNKLVELGHSITVDWTDHEYPKNESILSVWAVLDIYGVQQCDEIVILFLTEHQYRGALVEMGGALALHKQVNIIGNAEASCIFINHPLVKQYSSIDNFLSSVKEGNKIGN